MALRFDHL